MQSKAKTVKAYLNEQPAEKREVLAAVRKIIRENIPKGYVETMNWGMICYEIPLKVYPDTYNKQPLLFAALAVQKNYFSLYGMSGYQEADRGQALKEAFAKAGKKLNMGKCCIRFRKLDDLPLEVIAEYVSGPSPDLFIKQYEKSRKSGKCE